MVKVLLGLKKEDVQWNAEYATEVSDKNGKKKETKTKGKPEKIYSGRTVEALMPEDSKIILITL